MMNLKLNAMHLHILELLKQLGIRCLIDDQYQDLSQDYMQLWLPQPLTETEVKQLEKFHKKHYAIWSNTEHPWGNVKRDLELEHMDAGSYSKTKATLVMIRMTERLEFEQAWQQRIGAVCNDTNLDFVASRCDQPAVIDAQSQAIANSFSDDWLKTIAALELFDSRYLVYNKVVRGGEMVLGDSSLLHLWLDPDGDNPKQARKAIDHNTGNPGGIANYKRGARTIKQGKCLRKTELNGRDFAEVYQRRQRININGVMISMMNPEDFG